MTRSGKAATGNVLDAVRSGASPVWRRSPRTPRGCRVRRISDGARDGTRDGRPRCNPAHASVGIRSNPPSMQAGRAKFTKHTTRDWICLLYTSDAADERSSVDLGGRRIIKKKKKKD